MQLDSICRQPDHAATMRVHSNKQGSAHAYSARNGAQRSVLACQHECGAICFQGHSAAVGVQCGVMIPLPEQSIAFVLQKGWVAICNTDTVHDSF
jgi:hypothetical protein